ncbi:MAG: UDP-N-acetylmuramoyl-L-alanyl-D-glutamate--2,6-diaminopimelate ligase [Oscillospiraceae bacterium]|nr:UDP-N-acetylmuramoyl-L-alanyl-D-glutamate--2,6-diaminopimelate ligase [Oscillospiraceae bacterium]
MLISKLLAGAGMKTEIKDKDIKLITDDSRKCTDSSVFVCHRNARQYVNEALEKGVPLVIAEEKLCENCVVVTDTRKAYAELCSAYFDHSHRRLKLIAVTGTNGKTTVAAMLHTILRLSGKKCGMISTVEYDLCEAVFAGDRTTPDCFELHSYFDRLVRQGAEYCILEASSQGISQKRLWGLHFDTVIFTNLTEDHLDYHGTMENYLAAKKEIFSQTDCGIINLDDPYADEFIGACKGKVITYSSKNNEADFLAKCIKTDENGSDYALVTDYIIHRIKVGCPGEFNVMNSLAAVAAAYGKGISLEFCAHALRAFSGVRGRMELLDTGTDYKVIIDYAHTPDALSKVLLCLGNFPHNRIITVFGCGGERDAAKRPIMGETAARLSDILIITSDNPRGEDPQKIIDDILSGIKKPKKSVYIHENRRKAIEYALKTAGKNDIILLAGKGHERDQEIAGEKHAFDERKIVGEILSQEKSNP